MGLIFLLILFFLYLATNSDQDYSSKEDDLRIKKASIIKHMDYKTIGDEFIALDLETTGLSQDYDKIIEVAAIKYSNGIKVETFHTLINPKTPIPREASNINGITNNMVVNKPLITGILTDLLDFIGPYPIVGHNVGFDIGFLRNACKEHIKDSYHIRNRPIDTLSISRELFPNLNNYRLKTVSNHLGFNTTNLHRATDDAILSAKIYLKKLELEKDKKKKAIKNLSNEEIRAMEIVKEVLIKNNRPINIFSFYQTQLYFDLTYHYSFIRLKLTGRKRYLLDERTPIEIRKLYGKKYDIKPSSKTEGKKTRFIINSAENLINLEDVIVDLYDNDLRKYEDYLEHINSFY